MLIIITKSAIRKTNFQSNIFISHNSKYSEINNQNKLSVPLPSLQIPL